MATKKPIKLTARQAAARLLLEHLDNFNPQTLVASEGNPLEGWKMTAGRAEKIEAAVQKFTNKFIERLERIAG